MYPGQEFIIYKRLTKCYTDFRTKFWWFFRNFKQVLLRLCILLLRRGYLDANISEVCNIISIYFAHIKKCVLLTYNFFSEHMFAHAKYWWSELSCLCVLRILKVLPEFVGHNSIFPLFFVTDKFLTRIQALFPSPIT